MSKTGRYYQQSNSNFRKDIKPKIEPNLPERIESKKLSDLRPSPSTEILKKSAINDDNNQENPNAKPQEKKFTQRSRLFCGNLPLDISQDDFKAMFQKYGEISEIYLNNEKGYGFVRLDTRANAEQAKWELDGIQLKNRTIRVRYATHGAALSIKNFSPFVTNELLEKAFTQFGVVERAVVITDERGRSTERGIVEFARKSSANKALQQIKDGVFLITSSPRAVTAMPLEQEDAEDGLSEKIVTQSPQFFLEREGQPRFAQVGTFEHEFGMRWKALDEMERQQREQLDKTIANAKAKLESEMEDAIHEHKTMLMKQDLLRRQEELMRLEDARRREMDRRKQLELAREDAQKKELERLAQQQEILRARVEGHGFAGGQNQQRNNRGDNDFRRSGDHLFNETIAQELLAGNVGMNRQTPSFDDGNNQGRRNFNQPPGPGFGNMPPQRRGFGNNTGYDNGQKRRRY